MLASRYQDPLDAYNIYIGTFRNTEISLWKGSTKVQEKIINNPGQLLHQIDMRDFWVSWEGGRIQLGNTKIRGLSTLIDYVDPSPFTVTAMALAGDRGAYAQWKFLENMGEYIWYRVIAYNS
jgi:hypothetical protein